MNIKNILLTSVISVFAFGLYCQNTDMIKTSLIKKQETTKAKPTKQKEIKKPEKKEKELAVSHVQGIPQYAELMTILPSDRAKDLAEAFTLLKKESPISKILLELKDGTKIKDILNITPMKGGTLILFKLSTMHGNKYFIARIEQIKTIKIN